MDKTKYINFGSCDVRNISLNGQRIVRSDTMLLLGFVLKNGCVFSLYDHLNLRCTKQKIFTEELINKWYNKN